MGEIVTGFEGNWTSGIFHDCIYILPEMNGVNAFSFKYKYIYERYTLYY